ncbi:uncharacterized protein LOC122868769 isoform X2 [Siniperca chuatsi]|uniref:uncharacterized protein LOC122868769 isoform X2 n=1 Tax=Siniperca chuatsi TaxID=119488 RepID=UPI001CE03B95|nr:uncharacterized protein LOC122868769 isoform X2 [Siniperca chuatsi]
MAHQGEGLPPLTCTCSAAYRACYVPFPHLSIQSDLQSGVLDKHGRTLERFRRRIERLKLHHSRCERRLFQTASVQVQKAMAVMPTQLDYIREDPESDSSGSELSSHTGSDTDYKPTQITPSSRDEEDLKSRDIASSCEKLSSDEELKGPDSEDEAESQTSTSVTVPQRERKRDREVVEDGGSDLFSPKNRHDQGSEDRDSDIEDGGSEPRVDWSSDIDDESPGPNLAKRQKKRRKKKAVVKERDGEADHLSPQKTLEHCSGDGTSDMDDQSPGLNLAKRQKKRRKKKAAVKEREGPKVQLKRPWSEAERIAVYKQLGKFMAERRFPAQSGRRANRERYHGSEKTSLPLPLPPLSGGVGPQWCARWQHRVSSKALLLGGKRCARRVRRAMPSAVCGLIFRQSCLSLALSETVFQTHATRGQTLSWLHIPNTYLLC